jgi:hypothetical protein
MCIYIYNINILEKKNTLEGKRISQSHTNRNYVKDYNEVEK